MSSTYNLRGTSNSIFKIGKGGPQLKNASGTLEARNVSDGAYVNFNSLGILDTSAATAITIQTPGATAASVIFNDDGAITVPDGTTGQRPSTGVAGMIRYNSSLGAFEGFTSSWGGLAAGASTVEDLIGDADATVIVDGVEAGAAAVNNLQITNALANNNPEIAAVGDSTNIGIDLKLKGTGALALTGSSGNATIDLTGAGDTLSIIGSSGNAIFDVSSAGDQLSILGSGGNILVIDGSIASAVNYISLASAATANAPIITNIGTDTNGVGLGLTIRGKTATAAGNGGALILDGGNGFTTGTGGAITITGGDSAGASGTAGSVTIDAGALAGGAAGSVTIAGSNATTLTLGTSIFPVGSIADSSILVYDTANVLSAITATTGGSTQQVLQFDDSGDTFSWIDKSGISANGFGIVTGDSGTATSDSANDTLQLQGATSGGITTVGSDAPELVTFSITPVDLATTGATIVGGDFMIVSDSADSATTLAQKVTWTSIISDLGLLTAEANGFGIVTGDSGTATSDTTNDTLQLQGAANGGITTVGSDAPELVTFSITPIDLATTGATIVGGDFMIISDSADAATTVGQKVTWSKLITDLGLSTSSGDPNYVGEDGAALPSATGTDSLAMGPNALADGVNSIALGGDATTGAQARATGTIAIGEADAREAGTIAIGINTQAGQTAAGATETHAIAIGTGAISYEDGSIAIGEAAIAGVNTASADPFSIAIGAKSLASGLDSVAIGGDVSTGARAINNGAIAIGGDGGIGSPLAAGLRAISIGGNAQAHMTNCIGVGVSSDSREFQGIAIGANSQAGQTDEGVTESAAIALGPAAKSFETNAIAIGNTAVSGVDAATDDPDSIAIGAFSDATGEGAIAIGGDGTTGAQATADGAIAIGGDDGGVGAAVGSGVRAIAIGAATDATAINSIALGYQAQAIIEGMLSISNGSFSTAGDSQAGLYILRASTTTATIEEMFLDGDGGSVRMVLPNDTTWTFDIQIVARRATTQQSAGYHFTGVIDRDANAASTALVGTVSKSILAEDDITWDVVVNVDTTNGSLRIQVTGASSTTIRWMATVRTTEITLT